MTTPPTRALTPGPSPVPSHPPSPGEGNPRVPPYPCWSPSSPGEGGWEGTGEEGRGGEGPGGGTVRRPQVLLFLLLFLLAIPSARGAQPQPPPDLAMFGGRDVLLLAPPEEAESNELVAFAIRLDLAVREMAPLVPVELKSKITVMLELDSGLQGRSTNRAGEPEQARKADLHLALCPPDLPAACRLALAGVLLERAGLAKGLPPELAQGAALWLAREHPADASSRQEIPAMTAVIDRLPGATLAAKLEQVPRKE